MKYEKEVHAEALILTIKEQRLVLDTLDPVYREFLELIKNQDKNVLIDLAEVGFFDSFAVGFIMDIFRTLFDKKLTLALTNVNEKIATLLKITRVDSVVKIYPSRKEALEKLKNE